MLVKQEGGATVTFVKILCPVDFSEHSQRAVRFAALLARSFGSQITLLHVNDPVLVATSAIVYAQRAEDETRADLHRLLDEALADDRHRVRDVTVLITEGDPSEQIATVAEEYGLDLIVMGTHGLGGYRKLLIGSTTERLLRRTTIPVAAVPLAESTLSLEDSLRAGSGSVVAAIDFSEPSRHAARMAAGVATELGLGLVLLHVLKPTRTVLRWREQAAARDKSRMEEARAQLDALAMALQPVTVTDILIVSGHPADEIAATAIQRNASLIAMGLGGKDGLFAPSPGSIAYRTLCKAPMPVLAVPASNA
jgi:nucleotide-binding universal stress UspA family protein